MPAQGLIYNYLTIQIRRWNNYPMKTHRIKLAFASALMCYLMASLPSTAIAQEALRHVKVKASEQKYIALTFDDGPIENVTESLLVLLDKYQAKATFFNVGKKVKSRPHLTLQIVEAGHEVANHSWSHKNFLELNAIEQHDEIDKFQQQVKLLGIEPTLFRAPFLKVDESIKQTLTSKELTLVSAKIMAKDAAKHVDIKAIVKRLSTGIESGDIILMHERKHTVEALKELLPLWQKQGFEFVTVSQLLSLSEANKANKTNKTQ